MRIQAFQVSLVEQTRKQLPNALKRFEPHSFFSIVKISYRHPKLHYEVWVRGPERLIKVGLHLEFKCSCGTERRSIDHLKA